VVYKDVTASSFNDLIASYKKRARNKGRKFTLSSSQFRYLTKLECHYCGAPPNRKHNPAKFKNSYIYSGVDRIDSSKGYTPKNCVACCYDCNRTKSDLSHAAFLSYLARLVSNQLLKLANKGAPTGEAVNSKRKGKAK
jgi:hypothetical protein